MNALIVEGKDDVAFIEYLIKYIQLDNIEVKQFAINELGGFSEEALIKDLTGKLSNILTSANRNPIEKIGIIIDLDLDETNGGHEKRLGSVNNAIKMAFQNNTYPSLPKVDELVPFEVNDSVNGVVTLEIACHFIGVNGKGELEDFLKEIKKVDSPHADCLDSWNCCLSAKGIDKKTAKEINKSWIHYYLKYDAFSSYSNSRKPDDRFRKLENIFLNFKFDKDNNKTKLFNKNVTSELFDFEKEDFTELNKLKGFLTLFKSESAIK